MPQRFFLGECGYLGLMAAAIYGYPLVDIDDPNNCYRNSISYINGGYNHLCFNDGYHISHHLKAARHWSDHPHEIIENKSNYIKENAIVFEKIDFLGVWILLMLKKHKKLAGYFVNLNEKKVKNAGRNSCLV